MTKNIIDSGEFRKKLDSRLQFLASKTGESIQRLRRKVAFERLLARISTTETLSFFLKGGYGMELRIAEARATKDLDLTYFKRSNGGMEPESELILQELQTFARIDLNDHFIYQIGQPQRNIENAPYGGTRHSVAAFINNKPFIEFHLDVGGDFLIDDIERVSGNNFLDFCDIPTPLIPMISIEQQFAEKLHSYTLPREHLNTRAKDLIDLVLLLKFKNRAQEAFLYNIKRVFRARNTHQLPITLAKPPLSWQKPFSKMALECGISLDINQAFSQLSDFYSILQNIL